MKTTNLKVSRSVLLAATSLVLCVAGAHADWTVSGPTQLTVTPGESGTSTYIFTPPGSPPSTGMVLGQISTYEEQGSGLSMSIDPTAPIINFLPATSPVGEGITASTPFEIVVDWTISSNPSFVGNEFSANYSIATDAYGTAGASENFIINAAPAPEPTQTLAGALLLGSGCVLLAGRRLLKKKEAKA